MRFQFLFPIFFVFANCTKVISIEIENKTNCDYDITFFETPSANSIGQSIGTVKSNSTIIFETDLKKKYSNALIQAVSYSCVTSEKIFKFFIEDIESSKIILE
jgi:hypothetical protein